MSGTQHTRRSRRLRVRVSPFALDRQDEARARSGASFTQSSSCRRTAGVAPHPDDLRDVRRAELPKIARERYAEAKTAFDRKDPTTVRQFDDLLMLLDDSDLHDWSAAADLRAVASAFRDLAKAVAAPASPVADVKTTAPVSQPLTPPDITYTSADSDITPQVPLVQRTPQWRPSPSEAAQHYRGVLRLLIDRAGTVVSATMPTGTRPAYDQALVRAARDWKLQPALKQGRPVSYLKIIEIHLTMSAP
jgi:hypothetical protein